MMIKRIGICVLIGILSCLYHVQAAVMTSTVIDLRHQQVKDMLPILRPLLAEDGVLSGKGDTLIIRTTPENLAELRRVIAKFEHWPSALRITLRRGKPRQTGRQHLIATTQNQTTQGIQQSLVVLDGEVGKLEFNQKRMIATRLGRSDVNVRSNFNAATQAQDASSIGNMSNDVNARMMNREQRYQSVNSFFMVKPLVIDEHQVRVAIDQKQQRFERDGSSNIIGDGINTKLVVPFGQWRLIRGVGEEELTKNVHTISTQSNMPMGNELYIKVDKVRR